MGGVGHDYLDGGLGNNTLIGGVGMTPSWVGRTMTPSWVGFGNDILMGGQGSDRFVYTSSSIFDPVILV
jgi:Ca2+-binding RTX toxin-like protein